MDETVESAPPFEPGEDDLGETRRMEGRSFAGYGWGNMPAPPPDYGYGGGVGNPYPVPPQHLHHPPPFYPPVPGPPPASGLYPPIGLNPPGFTHPRPSFHGAKPYYECPVCREMLSGKIYKCYNGHVICQRCIGTLDYCRDCGASLDGPKIRHIELERIIMEEQGNTFSEVVRCSNSFEGCEVTTSPDHFRSHQEVCEFRPVSFCSKLLGWTNCSALVSSHSLLSHLRDAHENQIKEIYQAKFTLKLVLPSNVIHSATPGAIWEPILITSALDINVLIKPSVSPQGHFMISGFLLGGSVTDARNYRVKYELNSKAKTSRLEWTGSLLSYRHINLTDHLPYINSFRIPVESLKQFAKSYIADDDSSYQFTDPYELKIKVAVWNISDDIAPFRECFRIGDTGEKELLEKISLFSFPPTGDHTFSDTHLYSGTSSYLPPDTICSHCSRQMYGVMYQCLQCPPTTYFCRHCIEVGSVHLEHLTLRVSNPEQIPLASVAYECASGDLS